MKYFIAFIIVFILSFTSSIAGENSNTDAELTNKLMGKCWDYEVIIDDKNHAERQVCFYKDKNNDYKLGVYYVWFVFENGIGEGMSSGWDGWYIKNNVIYLISNGSEENATCTIYFANENPRFKNCIYDGDASMEKPWGTIEHRKNWKN